jgi:transposase
MPELSESQWNRIKDALPGQAHQVGRTAQDNRLFVEAVYWVARNGARWRTFPLRSEVAKAFLQALQGFIPSPLGVWFRVILQMFERGLVLETF